MRDDGKPKLCLECYKAAMRENVKKRKARPVVAEPKRKSPGKPKRAVTEQTVLQILDKLQERIREHLSEARRLHTAALTIKEYSEVEYKIEALTLLGE
jgi:ribosome-binding protein aMBF1 (putative translation factor)